MTNTGNTKSSPKAAVRSLVLRLESTHVRLCYWREVGRLVRCHVTRRRRWCGSQDGARLLGLQLDVHQQLLEGIHTLVQLFDIRLHTHTI